GLCALFNFPMSSMVHHSAAYQMTSTFELVWARVFFSGHCCTLQLVSSTWPVSSVVVALMEKQCCTSLGRSLGGQHSADRIGWHSHWLLCLTPIRVSLAPK